MSTGRIISNRFRLFKRDTLVLFFAIRHQSTPALPKLLALLTVVYLVSPIDAVPDFIPFFGYLDDLIITPFLISTSVRLLPAVVRQDSELQARRHGRRLSWILAAFVVLLLLLMTFLLVAGWKLLGQLF